MTQQEQRPCVQKRIKMWLSKAKPEDIALLIVVIATIFAYTLFLVFYSSAVFFSFLTSWTAGISGILIGFALDRRIERAKDDRIKRDFLKLIHNELIEIRGKIPPQTKSVLMLYPDVWVSLISSGVVRLLSPEQVTKLSKVYKSIEGTQYEAEWVRRAIEEFNNVPESEDERRQWLRNRYQVLWDRHLERGKELSKEIGDLIQEKWWN